MNEGTDKEYDQKNKTVASSESIMEKKGVAVEKEIKNTEKKETKITEKKEITIDEKKEENKVTKTEESKRKETTKEEIKKESKNIESTGKKEKSNVDVSDSSKINKENKETVENKVKEEKNQNEIEKKHKVEKSEKENSEKVKETESNAQLKKKETNEKRTNEKSVMKKTSETKKESSTKLKTNELKKDNSLNAASSENQYTETGYTTGNQTIQKFESRLNPVAPEFKPKNALYVYKKIEKQIKRNLILLIKSFGYKGIKLENIFGEYCKKYNALLNLNQAGFTSIYDMLKSLEYCLIFEDIKETNKICLNETKDTKQISEEEKEKLDKPEKEDIVVLEKEEKKEDKKETRTSKNMEDQNLLIKYKTPKMNEEKQFFVKIVLGTVAESTNYNSEKTEQETDSTNCISLTKLPQEVKRNFGSFFNLKLLQMRYGIDKLQTFLEEIQELEIFQLNNDIKIRITPLTHNSKIPQIKPIKLYRTKETESTSSPKGSTKKNTTNSKPSSTVENAKGENKKNESKVSETSDHSVTNENEQESSLLNTLNEGENMAKFKSNVYSEEFMNMYNSKFYNSTSDTTNKCFVPKILSKSQIHILLFQLIVILFERQQIELEEINRIKEYILSGRTPMKREGGVTDESNTTKETEINISNTEGKEANILDFINTSKTNGSSDYMNESIKTYDTSTPFKLEDYLRGESHSKYSEELSNVSEKEDNERQEDEAEEGEKFIGVFVSSIKTEWSRFYPEQYPLSFYLNYYKIIKLRKLLEEIPNLIISGFSRLMQVFTLDAAQEYYDKLPSSKQKNLKVFSKFKFTTLSNSDLFNTETYKSFAKSYMKGEDINLTQILGKEEVQKLFSMNSNKGNYHKTNTTVGSYQSSNFRDFNNYKTDELNPRIKSTVFKNNNNNNNNIEILRYHLHKLLYNLVIHVSKKQNALFTKYKTNGIILSEYEMNRQLCGPFYYANDLSYEDFKVPKKSYFEKNYIARYVSQLSDYGIHGIKFIHLRNEWFKLYKCDLRPLMKICNYHKIGQMLSSIPSVHVYGEGFDIKYVPNTNMKVPKAGVEGNAFNDLLRGNLKKTSTTDYGYQNRMSFQRQAKTMMNPNQNINNSNNRTYDNIMNLLYTNPNYQRNNSMQRYATHAQTNYRDINELKKMNTGFPNMMMGTNYIPGKSNYFKNNSNVCDLFKNM